MADIRYTVESYEFASDAPGVREQMRRKLEELLNEGVSPDAIIREKIRRDDPETTGRGVVYGAREWTFWFVTRVVEAAGVEFDSCEPAVAES